MTRATAAPATKRIVGAIVLFLALAALGVALVRRMTPSNVVATLLTKAGDVDRDFHAKVGTWSAASPSARFTVGDGVRTAKDASATLELADESKLTLESNTAIRFLDRPSAKHAEHLDLQTGEARLQTGGDALSLQTEIGSATIAAGSQVTLRKSDQGMRYEVTVGAARFEGQDGKNVDLVAGQGLVVGIGAATLDRYDVKKDEPKAPPTTPAVSAAAPVATAPPPATGDVNAHIAGSGASVRLPGETQFTHVNPGDTSLAAGATLRLKRGTTAAVARSGQRATLRGAGEFVVGETGKPFIVAGGGGVSLAGSDTELEVAVPGGSLIARLGAKAEVTIQKDETHVAVSGGNVKLSTAQGNEELHAGEDATIGEKGLTEVAGRGPGYSDFIATPGASFAVHDPSPPTAVGFSVGSECPDGAVVEIVGQPKSKARGNGVVSVLFASGRHTYAVHCIGSAGISTKTAASGTIAVLHDGGTARIPRTAPATLVDADGRNYTVLYQNVLPKLTVRWPGAPPAGPYTLTLTAAGGKASTYTSATPSYTIPPGVLREGSHKLAFAGGGARSGDTHVHIKFDNAAPTATLTSPQNGSFAPGQAVTVSGVSLEGFKISVAGTNLPLDSELRFSGQVVVPSGQRALAVEFVHPTRGVQYYLRKSSAH